MYYIKKSTQGWECMKKEKLKEKVISNFKKEEFIDLLSDIIKIPSHKEVDWQEDKIANYLYDYLKINNIDEVKLDYIKENRPNVKVGCNLHTRSNKGSCIYMLASNLQLVGI